MRAICVDDEKLVLEDTVEELKSTQKFNEIVGFREPHEALEYLSEHSVDIAFLDINMVGMDGMELARRIKADYPRTHIVFVTGYSEYSLEAFQLHASGYLLKPITKAAILDQLEYMKEVLPASHGKRFRAQTFGNFEFYVDGKPVNFSCAKAKEILAYLVDRRGTPVTIEELSSDLFDDRKNEISAKSGVRNALSDLSKGLKNANADSIIQKSHGRIAIDTNLINCDYYSMLAGDVTALNAYMGEYMAQYSWAEVTLASIGK